MRKILFVSVLSLLISSFTSMTAFSAPNKVEKAPDYPVTLGKLGVGGQTSLSGSGSYISARLSTNNSLNLNLMGSLNLVGTSISIGAGAQGEFMIARNKETRTYFGAGLMIDGIGTGLFTFSMIPSMGVEYFLTDTFSADAAIGLPISLQLTSGTTKVLSTSAPFSVRTAVQPILGFHYYF
jgi:hypothetical protein